MGDFAKFESEISQFDQDLDDIINEKVVK